MMICSSPGRQPSNMSLFFHVTICWLRWSYDMLDDFEHNTMDSIATCNTVTSSFLMVWFDCSWLTSCDFSAMILSSPLHRSLQVRFKHILRLIVHDGRRQVISFRVYYILSATTPFILYIKRPFSKFLPFTLDAEFYIQGAGLLTILVCVFPHWTHACHPDRWRDVVAELGTTGCWGTVWAGHTCIGAMPCVIRSIGCALTACLERSTIFYRVSSWFDMW